MKAIDLINKKHGSNGFEPMMLTLEVSEIIELMEEYADQQLKNCNLQNVTYSLPLIEGKTKDNMKNTIGKKRQAPPPPRPTIKGYDR